MFVRIASSAVGQRERDFILVTFFFSASLERLTRTENLGQCYIVRIMIVVFTPLRD